MRYLIGILTTAAAVALASNAHAQVAGGVMGGGGTAGMVGGMAGGGLGGAGIATGGMANGGLMGGNQAAGMQGGQLGGGTLGTANLAASPGMGFGANMRGAAAAMRGGMPGAAIGGNNMAAPNGNNMAVNQGGNLGLASQGARGSVGGAAFSAMYGNNSAANGLQGAQGNGRPNNMFPYSPTGRFSSWGGTRGNFAFGHQQALGSGFGISPPNYTGSPIFGRTNRQQMYYNAYGNGNSLTNYNSAGNGIY